MMGSAANVRTFLAKLERGQPGGRRREHELILASPASASRPEAIDITSRGYWYEQFRRSAFDFDSQSVRPYFPYAQVEAGVLETAARLFKIEFRRSTAPAGTRRFRSSRSSTAAGPWAASISICIPARARTSGSPPRRWSPASAAAPA
jgi:hypothetical protein